MHIASATVTSGIEAHIDGVSYDVSESIKKIFSKIRAQVVLVCKRLQ